MNIVEIARDKYYKEIKQQQQLLEMLNSNDIQKLEKMGLITINKDIIPNEQKILHDSFYSTAINQPYYNDGIYVYICDLQDRGKRTIDRRFTNVTIRNKGESLPYESPCNVSVYIGLLTEMPKFNYLKISDSFQHFNTIIQLPYSYTITETHNSYPDYFYPLGSWPLTYEFLKVDGFQEQFMSLQEHFFRNLLEHSWKESVKEIQKQAVLQKVCKKK